jgi:hypothetical protein
LIFGEKNSFLARATLIPLYFFLSEESDSEAARINQRFSKGWTNKRDIYN